MKKSDDEPPEIDMNAVHDAISKGLSDLRHTNSPLARMGERLHRYETGQWEDEDFTEVDRDAIVAGLDRNDIRHILLYVEPMMPYYYLYRGVRIIGGSGWWQLEDGERFKVITDVFDYIDNDQEARGTNT